MTSEKVLPALRIPERTLTYPRPPTVVTVAQGRLIKVQDRAVIKVNPNETAFRV